VTRRTALVLAPPAGVAVYLCPVCHGRWGFQAVRHTLCCPECAGGLLRIRPGEPGADTSTHASAIP
jgi:hypothetical protein